MEHLQESTRTGDEIHLYSIIPAILENVVFQKYQVLMLIILALCKAEFLCRSCVEKAAAVGTPNAIRYVRRAAELCDALTAPVPGLCQECLDYIKAHPSNVYDMAALHLFAKGLKAAGQKDKAAAVYFTLLEVKFMLLAR